LLSVGIGRVGVGRGENRRKSRLFAHPASVNPWFQV
jgi:hypothetical protein